MNYGISVLFRAIPLLMALFCFGYGFFVFNYGVDSSRFVAGPVVFSLGFICIALFATAATIIRQIIHTCHLRGGPYNRMRSDNGYRLYPIHLNTNERQKRRSQNTRQSVQLLAGGILDPCSIIYIHSRMDLGLPVASA